MLDELKGLGESRRWRLMVDAARRAAEEGGEALERLPGRGLSNVWNARRPDGTVSTVSIRTTMDRWYAFPPLAGGTRWKTLDDVDEVLVAAVDDRDSPTAIEVYRFPAGEVRERFNESYSARQKAGQSVRDNFGMWVSLDPIDRGVPADVGAGMAEKYPPIAVYPLAQLLAQAAGESEDDLGSPAGDEVMDEPVPTQASLMPGRETIADVVSDARARIAAIAGVSLDAVKLDLKLEL